MSFVLRFGNMPIIANNYNKTFGANSLFANGGSVYWETIRHSGGAEEAEYIITHGLDMGVLDVNSWSSQHNKLFTGVLKSTNVLHPDTIIEYGCTGKTTVGGVDKAIFSYLANPALSLPVTQAGESNRNGYRVYGLGVACYSDALGANLSGVFIAYCAINLGIPAERRSAMFFEPSFDHSIISGAWLQAHGYSFSITSSDDDFGDESTNDGYGQNGTHPAFDHSSDVIGLPPIPSVSTSSVGFIHLYNVTQNQLNALSDYLFPDVLQDIADIMSQLPVALADLPNVLVPILRAFASIFAYRDSVQYIIDLHAIPCAPSVGGSDYIKVGALSTDITAGVISSDYVEVDCGALSIPEQFQNFLDYMVACKIYIPFVGFVDIKPELWNGGTIGLKYRFNVIDGSFMAYLVATSGKSKLTNTIIGQYGGSACLHLPMVAAEYGAIIGGIVQGSLSNANAGAAAAAGNASQLASAEAGLASALMQFDANPKMSQSNGYNASSSFLGGRTPYLMIEYPVPQFSAKYTHEKGLPLNVTMAFKDLRGYTEIDESVDLSGIQAPIDIIDEIRSALASGTIF